MNADSMRDRFLVGPVPRYEQPLLDRWTAPDYFDELEEIVRERQRWQNGSGRYPVRTSSRIVIGKPSIRTNPLSLVIRMEALAVWAVAACKESGLRRAVIGPLNRAAAFRTAGVIGTRRIPGYRKNCS
jgi:hypothetical protein